MQKVDEEIRRIIDEQYELARKLIEDNRDKVEAMAKALLEWETLDAEQIDDIMAGKPPRPPKPAAADRRAGRRASDGGAQGAAAPAAVLSRRRARGAGSRLTAALRRASSCRSTARSSWASSTSRPIPFPTADASCEAERPSRGRAP